MVYFPSLVVYACLKFKLSIEDSNEHLTDYFEIS